MESIPYRQTVGALLWIARATRPEISHAVGQVAKYMTNPELQHWAAVLRICNYLRRVRDVPLVIKADPSLHLEVYADSDWAGCPDDSSS